MTLNATKVQEQQTYNVTCTANIDTTEIINTRFEWDIRSHESPVKSVHEASSTSYEYDKILYSIIHKPKSNSENMTCTVYDTMFDTIGQVSEILPFGKSFTIWAMLCTS